MYGLSERMLEVDVAAYRQRYTQNLQTEIIAMSLTKQVLLFCGLEYDRSFWSERQLQVTTDNRVNEEIMADFESEFLVVSDEGQAFYGEVIMDLDGSRDHFSDVIDPHTLKTAPTGQQRKWIRKAKAFIKNHPMMANDLKTFLWDMVQHANKGHWHYRLFYLELG